MHPLAVHSPKRGGPLLFPYTNKNQITARLGLGSCLCLAPLLRRPYHPRYDAG